MGYFDDTCDWLKDTVDVDPRQILEVVENTVQETSYAPQNLYTSEDTEPGPCELPPADPSPAPTAEEGEQPSQTCDPSTGDDYTQGYQDGRSGLEARPGSLAGEALSQYEAGFAQGKSEYDAEQNSQSCGGGNDNYAQGYRDGESGAGSNPGSRQGDSLQEYQDGYNQGRTLYELQHPTTSPNPYVEAEAGRAYQTGYADGQVGVQYNRQNIQAEYLTVYDQGFAEGTKNPYRAPDSRPDEISQTSEEEIKKGEEDLEKLKQQQEADDQFFEKIQEFRQEDPSHLGPPHVSQPLPLPNIEQVD